MQSSSPYGMHLSMYNCRHWVTQRSAGEHYNNNVQKHAIKGCSHSFRIKGVGIAQWLEHRTRDWKVAGSNPCWNGGRIFFSGVDFLCWLLFRYPFHPRVTTVARKKSRSFCQKCRWQVTAKHAYTLRMWILLNRASALVTTCPEYVKWHLRTLSINSSSSFRIRCNKSTGSLLERGNSAI